MSNSSISQEAFEIFVRADALYSQGRRSEAIAAYTEGLALAPNAAYGYVQRGLAYQEDGHIEEAIRNYNKAIELDPTYGPAYYGRGWARNHLKDYAGELADAERGLALDPERPAMYWRRIGAAHHGLKNYAEALMMYNRVLELHPDDEGTLFNRALLFQYMGEYEHALADYQRALELDPAWNRVLINRTLCYMEMKLFDLAATDIAAFLAQHPHSEMAQKLQREIRKEQQKASGSFFSQLFRRKKE